jgi:alkanesulfonate monooxygenase SsuD/methylene tetrahydromethanopterin reductase-like flavin-dependent oxidoreductase (luciferase family)
MHDALVAPLPVQQHLPILVGGSGPRKTLRTTARYADAWNTSGWLEEVRGKVGILEEHCAAVGRDPSAIERTISFPIVIRDRAADAEARFAELLAHNASPDAGNVPNLLGSPEQVADRIRPFRDQLGFRHVIVRHPAPSDMETIERLAEVRELLGPDT